MTGLMIHQEKITDPQAFMALCPFGALEMQSGIIVPTAACKMCKLCIQKGPMGAAELTVVNPLVDKSAWKGVLVYVDHVQGKIHPVTFELLGKAEELAGVLGQPVIALMLGETLEKQAVELLRYGADEVILCEHAALKNFRVDAYAVAFEQVIQKIKPTAILVGATTVGRQLAPRVAARMRTGLTADCTVLEMRENSDLVQIRPAFGGNIMAQIITPNHRPQMATVRYKVMDAPKRCEQYTGKITRFAFCAEKLTSKIKVLSVTQKPAENSIEAAEVLVVAGRGVKKEEDLVFLRTLSTLLGGQLACTRPLVENGWMVSRQQIGLSGRTVRPKLIITCGVSGAIQFVAGMEHSATIIAINKDENATIFKTAHYGLVGDLYEILPALIRALEHREGKSC